MIKKCLKCLDVLGAKTRLKIIHQLRKRPQNVSQIAESFNLTQPTISYHLNVLEGAGMIRAKKTLHQCATLLKSFIKK